MISLSNPPGGPIISRGHTHIPEAWGDKFASYAKKTGIRHASV